MQRTKVKTAKINWYQNKVSQFQQNRLYKQIDGSDEGEEIVTPDAQDAKTFWACIWGQEHNTDATWLGEI